MATSQEEQRKLILDKYLENPTVSYRQIAKTLNLNHRTVGRVVNHFLETKATARKAGSGRKKDLQILIWQNK